MATNDTGANGASGTNSVTQEILDGLTLSSDGDYVLWALIHSDTSGTIDGVDWNPDGGSAQAMTSVLSGTQSTAGWKWELFRLANPTTRGAGQIEGNVSSSGFVGLGSAAFYDVDTSDPESDEDEVESTASGDMTNTVTTSAGSGQKTLGFHAFIGGFASESAGAGTTELADGGRSAVYTTTSGGSTDDLVVSLSAARDRSLIAFAINDAAGGDVSVTVPVKALTLSTFAPNIQHQINIPVASLTLSTFAPNAQVGVNVTIPVASLSLSTFAPSVGLGPLSVTVPVKALTLTTFAPTASVGAATSITVPVATLTLTTYAPTVYAPRVGTGNGLWALIVDQDGTTQLGALRVIVAAEIERALDHINTYRLVVPATDEDAEHLKLGGYLEIEYVPSENNPRLIGRIDSLIDSLDESGEAVIEVSGLSLAAELLDSSTYYGIPIEDDTVANAMDDLLATWGLSGWTDLVSGAGFVSFSERFEEMTVWAAMRWIAETQGGYIRETATSRQIEIKRGSTASGLSFRNVAAIDTNPNTTLNVVPVSRVGGRRRDSIGMKNRIVPQGQSSGGVPIDLRHSTRSSPYTIQSKILNYPSIVDSGVAKFNVSFNSANPWNNADLNLKSSGRNRAIAVFAVTNGTNVSNFDTAVEFADGIMVTGQTGDQTAIKSDVVVGDQDFGFALFFNPPTGWVQLSAPGLPDSLSTGTMDVLLVAVSLQDASQDPTDYVFSTDNSGSTTAIDTNALTAAVGDLLLGGFGMDSTEALSGRDPGQTLVNAMDSQGNIDAANPIVLVDEMAADGTSQAFGWDIGAGENWAAFQVRVQPQPIYYIEDSTQINLYGGANDVPRVWHMNEPFNRPVGITAAQLEDAANTLYDLAAARLDRLKEIVTTYEGVEIMGEIDDSILPGDSVELILTRPKEDEDGNATLWLNVEDTVFITRMIERFDRSGRRAWSFDLADQYQFFTGQHEVIIADLLARLKAIEESVVNNAA